MEFLGLRATSEQLEDPAALTKSRASTGSGGGASYFW